MEIVRANIIVSGRVQGVWYRASAVEAAERIGGITGWARNLPGGDVEVVCEGKREKVERLIAWLQQGPPAAKVSDVQVTWEKATGEFSGFTVRY